MATTRRAWAGLFVWGWLLTGLCAGAPAVYRFQGTGSGTVGSVTFSNVAFNLILVSDTNQITTAGTIVRTPDVAGASINIAGFGTGTFTNTQAVFEDQGSGLIEFTGNVAGSILYGSGPIDQGSGRPIFSIYNLQYALGPVALATPASNLFVGIPTSLGSVTLSSVSNVTFSANVITCNPSTQFFQLIPGSPAGPAANIRFEGQAELTSDLLLNCSGLTPGPPLKADVQVSFDRNLANANEMLLLVNTPVAQVVGVNVFPGSVAGSKVVVFKDIPLSAADPTSVMPLRVVNIRVDATASTAASVYGTITLYNVGTLNSFPATIDPTPQLLAKAMPGLDPLTKQTDIGLCGYINPSQAYLNPNFPVPTSIGSVAGWTATPTFTEGFVDSFRIRGSSLGTTIPGFQFHVETGFHNPTFPPPLDTAGLATQGTRLTFDLYGIPSIVGLSVYVAVKPIAASSGVDARLVTTDLNGGGPYNPTPPFTKVTVAGTPVDVVPVVLNGVTKFNPVWEILSADPAVLENVTFGVLVAIASPTADVLTLNPGFTPREATSTPRFAPPPFANIVVGVGSGCKLRAPLAASLPPGTVGAPYKQTIAVPGAQLGFTFGAFGNVPPGLGISAAGVFSGTPTQAGLYSFTVEASGPGPMAAQDFTITIAPALTIKGPATLPDAAVGSPYRQVLTGSGGTLPYSFRPLVPLPTGLTLSAEGVLSGVPAVSGNFSFVAIVTDAAGAMAMQAFTIVIVPQPLQVSPSALTFQGAALSSVLAPLAITVSTGLAPAKPFFVSVLRGDCLNSFSPRVSRAGTTPAVLTVTADPAGLGPGTYCAIIRIAAADAAFEPVDIPVTLTLRMLPAALLVTPATLPVRTTPSNAGQFTRVLTVRNSGSGALEFTASRADRAPWLISATRVSPAGPNQPGTVAVKVDATGLLPGFYKSGVLLTAGDNSQTIPVLLYVSPDSAALGVDQKALRFKSRPGSSGAFTQTVTVLDVGATGTAIDWTADVSYSVALRWLTLGAQSGTARPGNGSPLPISLSPEAAGLPPGLYTALIKISPPDQLRAPQLVTVLLEQTDPSSPPEPELSPGGLFFKTRASFGLTPAQTLNVFATIDPPFQVSAQTADGRNWLLVTPASGNAAAAVANQLLVQVNPSGLPAGVYRGEVDVELGGSIRGANVTLVVLPEAPTATGQEAGRLEDAVCPSALAITLTSPVQHFSATAGFPETLIALVTDDCGNAVPGATVSASFSTPDGPLFLDPTSPDGAYAATWAPGNAAEQVAITVDASVVVSAGDGNNPPVIWRRTDVFLGGVTPPLTLGPPLVTSIGNNGDPVVSGSNATITGDRLAPATLVLVAGASPIIAPLVTASPTSVTFTVPALAGPRQFPVVVSANGLLSVRPLLLNVQ